MWIDNDNKSANYWLVGRSYWYRPFTVDGFLKYLYIYCLNNSKFA